MRSAVRYDLTRSETPPPFLTGLVIWNAVYPVRLLNLELQGLSQDSEIAITSGGQAREPIKASIQVIFF